MLRLAGVLLLSGTLAGIVTPGQKVDPDVAALVGDCAADDLEHGSPFFQNLMAIARRGGWRLDYAGLSGSHWADGGYAVDAGAGRVVVVLGGWSHTIPGDDFQDLLLLDPHGRLLDRLACSINARLTHFARAGAFGTQVLDTGTDGAQLVIRFRPRPGRSDVFEGGEHALYWRGKYYRFRRGQSLTPKELAEKGLARVGVKGDRFQLVFPPLERAFRSGPLP